MYRNRRDAGQVLARALSSEDWVDPVILALPRGGVPIADEVSRTLGIPFDLLVVRKVGAPGQPELGIGAVAEGGALYVDETRARTCGLTMEDVEALARQQLPEMARRIQAYRGGRPLPRLAGRTVLLIDDGIATGGTLRAAIRAARQEGAARVVVAAPVGQSSTLEELSQEADDVICPLVPESLVAIGQWYEDFAQLSDEEVLAILGDAWWRHDRKTLSGRLDVAIKLDDAELAGTLVLPQGAVGLVLFAHGSGSSRQSPRNQVVAEALQKGGVGTLLFDLLTEQEEQRDRRTREYRFNISLLATRLAAATRWVRRESPAATMPLGYFGASTGAAAALIAAARLGDEIRAVVSRGGRPDLAEEWLERVQAPTLLIVGSDDDEVVSLNQAALDRLRCEAELRLVPGATHLFEEPGAMEMVSRLALSWFQRHLAARPAAQPGV